MKSLTIIIDGIRHKYVKRSLSQEKYCQETCSIGEYCIKKTNLCNILDITGKCRPCGFYGEFKVCAKKE